MGPTEVLTNGHCRSVVYAEELTPVELDRLGMTSQEAREAAEDGVGFVRYRGWVYRLGDFSAGWGMRGGKLPEEFLGWDGFLAESYATGVLIRWVSDEQVVLGRFYAGEGRGVPVSTSVEPGQKEER